MTTYVTRQLETYHSRARQLLGAGVEDTEVDAPYDTDPDWSLATAAIPNTIFRPATAARSAAE